jgi:PAS domain S-box-containing protein
VSPAAEDPKQPADGAPGAGESLRTVRVPEGFRAVFLKAQEYVESYFRDPASDPRHGTVEFSGERYVMVRAASMSVEFFDLVASLYSDRGEAEARRVANSFLFDMAHALGRADARAFHAKMGVSDPLEKLSAGPIHFAHAGWAFVDILPESKPSADENYFLIYDHPYSFEADAWLKHGREADFPVCIMNAGYSSGWCEESFGVPLVAAEVECTARGDERCRFIMAHPSRIEEHLRRYGAEVHGSLPVERRAAVPEFFRRKRLAEALQESEERFRRLVESSPDAIVEVDLEGFVLSVNPATEVISGYTQDELVGCHFSKLGILHLRDVPRYLKLFAAMVKGDFPPLIEVEAMRKDGRNIWLEAHVSLVRRRTGERMVQAVVRDITERRRAEAALRESEEKWRSLAENAPNIVIVVDRDNRIQFVNHTVSGLSEEEVLGKSQLDYVQPEHREVVRSAIEHVFRTGSSSRYEVRGTGPRGEVSWYETRLGPIKSGDEVVAATLFVTDTTERKRAEQALRESEENYRLLVDNSPEIIARIDLEGRFVFVNRQFCELSGLSSDEVIGRGPEVIQHLYSPEEFANMVGQVTDGLASQRRFEFELRATDAAGLSHVLLQSGYPWRGPDGEVLGMELRAADVTRNKLAEAELARQGLYSRIRAQLWRLAADQRLSEEELIQRLLSSVGPALAVSRACFNVVEGEDLVCTVEWCAPEVKATLGSRAPRAVAEALTGGGMAVLTRESALAALPPEIFEEAAELIAHMVSSQDLESMLLMPCNIGGQPEGFVSMDICVGNPRGPTWSADEKTVVAEAVQVISQTIARRRAEAALRGSESRHRVLIEHIPAVTYTAAIDDTSTTLFISPQIEEMLGVSPEDYAADPDLWRKLLHPDDRERVLEEVVVSHDSGEPFRSEYRMQTAEGRTIWIRDEAGLVTDDAGRPLFLQGVMFDVTEVKRAEEVLRDANVELERRVSERTSELSRELQERVRAEQALRESEERYRSLAQTASDAIITMDGRGDIVFWNESAERIFGWKSQEVVGRSGALIVPEEHRGMHMAGLERVAAGGQSRFLGTREMIGARKDGGRFPLELSLATWRTSQGLFFTGIIRDITERQRARQELEQRHAELVRVNQELERLHRAKDEFVAMVSHELRTPLVTGLGYIELLLEGHLGPISGDAGAGMQVALRNLRRLSALIDDILSYYSLVRRDRKSGPVVVAFSPAEMLAECREEFLVRSGRDGSGVMIEAGGQLPHVLGDEDMIRRVISNLLDNAHRHAGEGAQIALEARPADAESVTISVADDGPGMSEEVQARVFEPFVKLSESREGAGLGLAIVRSVLEAHGTRPSLESAPGRGTTISFVLPAAAERGRGPRPASRGTPARTRTADGRRADVMVVDDDEDTLNLVRRELTSRGHSVRTSTTAEAALAMAREAPPDLFLLDVSLPGMSGTELCARLKSRPETAGIPVCMFSARAEEDARQRARRAGCDGYLVKPVVMNELLAAVDRALTAEK